jgi:ribosome maturation factor RimP
MASARDVIESVASRHLIEVEEIKQTKAGSRLLLRVVVDGDGASGHGLSLDEVAEVSREMSTALDETDAMGDRAYVLEVGTRGVDRPLTRPAQWRRNIGRLVKITLVDGDQRTGRIESTTDEAVTLTDGSVTPYGQVRKAVVQVEMNRAEESEQE